MKEKEVKISIKKHDLYLYYGINCVGFLFDFQKYGDKYIFTLVLPLAAISFEYRKK